MNELKAYWDPNNDEAISYALDRLFSAQDRALNAEKKAFLLGELKESNLPPKAILQGIQKLAKDNLKQIKVWTLVEAANEFMEKKTEYQPAKCDHCAGTGRVVMVDESRLFYSLACICENGLRNKALESWNGQSQMFSKGRLLEFPYA